MTPERSRRSHRCHQFVIGHNFAASNRQDKDSRHRENEMLQSGKTRRMSVSTISTRGATETHENLEPALTANVLASAPPHQIDPLQVTLELESFWPCSVLFQGRGPPGPHLKQLV
ncbi:uncharacterized protein LOC143785210 [Ranitomeya variabilis]|uniref:uncharacterized protein LOC143785210 n=1 Tax=Ranitomeya variabilis TaxID=490064 RepID=UPI00405636ED